MLLDLWFHHYDAALNKAHGGASPVFIRVPVPIKPLQIKRPDEDAALLLAIIQ